MKINSILMVVVFVFTVVFFAAYSVSSAHDYKYRIAEVIDGDTIKLEVSGLPPEFGSTISVRISGIDTPELKGHARCSSEESMALAAKMLTERYVYGAEEAEVIAFDTDKYGRILGDIVLDGELLSKKLIDKGVAVLYTGRGNKHDWCASESYLNGK